MKTDIERGPFGSWAFHTRDLLDVSVEAVAEQLGYHPASLRKVEAGGAVSRRLRRELPELYRQMASEKGVSLPPLPQEGEQVDQSSITALLAELLEEQRKTREAQETIAVALGELAGIARRALGSTQGVPDPQVIDGTH